MNKATGCGELMNCILGCYKPPRTLLLPSLVSPHEPPSALHTRGAVHLRPAVLLALQHWVAAVMHVPPHATLPVGQAAEDEGTHPVVSVANMRQLATARCQTLSTLSQPAGAALLTACCAVRGAAEWRAALCAHCALRLAALGGRFDAQAAALDFVGGAVCGACWAGWDREEVANLCTLQPKPQWEAP